MRNFSHSERNISNNMVEHTMITTQELRKWSRVIRIRFLDMKTSKKARWLPTSYAFWKSFGLWPRRNVWSVWVPSDPSPEHVPDNSSFGALQFTSDEVERGCGMWLGSYSSGRIQKIRIGEAVSKYIGVTSGVSQGSHLGPLCFIWFVNKISEIFNYVRVLF
jgi:hypothetical protein